MTITDFLKHFYPDENEVIHFRAITPKGSPKCYSLKLTYSRKQLREDREVQQKLKQLNKTHGLYFVVNAGGDKDDDITRINAVFCEMDEKPIQEQIDTYLESSKPTPSLLVETKKSVHAYWLLSESILPSEFVRLQKGLIKHFNSDEKIKNASRVMRIPYFNHVSIQDDQLAYKQCTLQFALGHTYNFDELISEFPYTEPVRKRYKKLYVSDDSTGEELVQRIKDTKEYHENGDYGYTRGVCHDGVGNNGIFVHLRTGAVKCFAKCSWHTIRESFGIYKENK
jgi:hypothetical protein